jgi:hypothetical protein
MKNVILSFFALWHLGVVAVQGQTTMKIVDRSHHSGINGQFFYDLHSLITTKKIIKTLKIFFE